MNRRQGVAAILLLVAVIGFISVYSFDRAQPDRLRDPDAFERELLAAVEGEEKLELAAVADFPWDTLHVFGPYTSWEEMERAVGTSWGVGLFGKWYRKTSLGQYPLDDDSFQKLVLVHGGKVVLDVTMMRRDLDFTPVIGRHDRDGAVFAIDRTREFPSVVPLADEGGAP